MAPSCHRGRQKPAATSTNRLKFYAQSKFKNHDAQSTTKSQVNIENLALEALKT
jgi:hypothetical protein